MGTTADKGAYLKDTKSLLKQKINNLGGDITDNTTFRQYADKLQNVYDILPKTTYAEGSNITLENCLKGKLDYEDDKVGYGDTKQDSTNGYQLWGGFEYTRTFSTMTLSFKYNSNGSFTINGSNTSGSNQNSMQAGNVLSNNYYKTLQAGTYIISGGTSDVTLQAIKIDDNSNVEILASNSGSNTTFTLTESIKVYLRVQVANGKSFDNVTIYSMLESGSTAHDWEKYTGGIPSPNPSYPQPIQVVTGEQEVVVRGKNRIKIDSLANNVTEYTSNGVTFKLNDDNSITINGDATGNAYCQINSNLNKSGGGKFGIFVISGTTTAPVTWVVYESGTSNGKTNTTANTNLGVLDNSITYTTSRLALLGASGHTFSNLKVVLMLIDDNDGIATPKDNSPYEPYITPVTKTLSLGDIELAKIGDYRDYIYRTYGKNLWGGFTEYTGTSAQVTFKFKNDGSIYANGTATGGNANVAVSTLFTNGIYATLKPGTYNVSCMNLITGVTLGIYDENTNSLGTSFTLTQETKVIIRIRVATGTSVNNTFKIQLEKGSSATDYQPYGSGKWYKHSVVGKRIFDGTESWQIEQSGTDNWYYSISENIGGMTGSAVAQLKCNYYQYASITSTTTGEGIWYSTSSVRIRYGTQDTPANFKTWLSTHNVLLYYILIEATDTEITDTTLLEQLEEIYNMQSVNGTTIIEINGNLPMIIKCRALSK